MTPVAIDCDDALQCVCIGYVDVYIYHNLFYDIDLYLI